jgi:hypothetical protein
MIERDGCSDAPLGASMRMKREAITLIRLDCTP